MKKLVLLLIILSFKSFATKAPDFTVTDYNNKIHNLYTDYLNKEKVVVIEIFFVDCPPCASIAPLMQPTYSKWGAGTGRVQFFKLSTMSIDNNARVKSYDNQYGMTFPGIGSDGGAAAALAPYRDNKTFGPWYGTPTFVVISPNGEVNYHVPFGTNNTVPLDTAIAQALRIPSGGGGGGNKCTDSFQIKVYNPYATLFTPRIVTYDYLNSANPKYDLIKGKYNCEFFFPAIRDYYVVGFEEPKEVLPALQDITTLDVVLLQKYILGIKPLNNLQLAIADVNNNQSITSSDIAELKKLILGVTDNLKVNKTFNWANNPKAINGKSSRTAFVSEIINKTASSEFAIGKYGDLSGAATIEFNGTKERSSCLVDFNINIRKFTNYYLYEISPKNPTEFVGCQVFLSGDFTEIFDLIYPSFEGLNADNFSINQSAQGKINMVWVSPSLKSEKLSNTDFLFSFKSNKIIDVAPSEKRIQEMVISNTEACNVNFNTVFKTSKKTIATIKDDAIIIKSESSINQLSLLDLNGGQRYSRKFNSSQREIELSCEQLSLQSGIYFIEIKLENGSTELNKIFLLR